MTLSESGGLGGSVCMCGRLFKMGTVRGRVWFASAAANIFQKALWRWDDHRRSAAVISKIISKYLCGRQ